MDALRERVEGREDDFSACTSSSASVNDLRREREDFEGRGAQTRSGVAATRGEDGGREGYVLAPFLGLGRLTRELAASLLQRVVVGAQHADGGGVRGLERRLGLALARGRVVQLAEDAHRACGEGAREIYRNGSGDVSFRETRGSRGTRRRVDGVPARAEGRDAHLSCAEWRCARRVDRRSVGRARASRGMRRARLDAPATKRRNGKMLSEGGTNDSASRSVPKSILFGLQIQTWRAYFFSEGTQSATFLADTSMPLRIGRSEIASTRASLQSWHPGLVGQIWGTPHAS